MLWDSWAKAGSANSNQKEQGFGQSALGENAFLRGKKDLLTRAAGEVVLGTDLLVTLMGCSSGLCSQEEQVPVSPRPCGPLGHTKEMLRQQLYGVA